MTKIHTNSEKILKNTIFLHSLCLSGYRQNLSIITKYRKSRADREQLR